MIYIEFQDSCPSILQEVSMQDRRLGHLIQVLSIRQRQFLLNIQLRKSAMKSMILQVGL
jgi:hypothetical protein